MTGKAMVAEATARQAVSFVLGAVAALTVIMLVQYRAPAAGLSRARLPGHFSGSRSLDHHRLNGTAARTVNQAPTVGAEDHHVHQANATLKANSTLTDHPAALSHFPRTDRKEEEPEEFRGLAAAVALAAMDDRNVIITCVNQAWAAPGSLLDLFLESFRIGDGTARLLPHVLVVSMDPAAHARCQSVHGHCYHYTMPGVHMNFTSAKFFGSKEWLEMVWSKLRLQRRVLELGYGFLFTDVDILWFRDPFKHVTAYADMTVSSDVYFGDPDNLGNFPNTGLFHVKPNVRTIAMTRLWHESRGKYPGAPNEQPALMACEQPLEAEILACLEGLELGLQHTHLPIMIETDCSQVISLIHAKEQDRSPFLHSISEIKELASGSRLCNFVKVDRSQVRISHCLANLARAENITQFWLGASPECVAQALVDESLVILSD